LRLDDSAAMQQVQARDGMRPLSEVLRSIMADFIEYRRRFHLELNSPRGEEVLEPDEESWHPLVISIRDRISEEVMAPVTDARKKLKNIAVQHKRTGKRLAAVLPLAPGLIALLLSFLITRRIANPIRELRRATERIAGGDFTRPINVKSRDEIGDLARAMNRMSQRLAELDEMKSGFLFNVSHELKTPLTSIKEAAALLQEEVPGTVNDKQRRLLEIISAETRILIGMIIDLLDLARMEAGRMGYKFERTSPGAIVRRAVDQLQFMAQRRGVSLTVSEAPQLGNFIIDGDKLVNAVKNLVGNAIKFSPRGGEVVISTMLAPPSAEPVAEGEAFWSTAGAHGPDRLQAPSVMISVSDQGPGIPERDLSLIFEKFYQSERRSDSKVKGTGLGLAIVRHVVEAHGGWVAVRSAPASGSTFTISLPLPASAGVRLPADRRPSVTPLEVKHNAV
jgi:two-component system sensor histidine kinase GlrK